MMRMMVISQLLLVILLLTVVMPMPVHCIFVMPVIMELMIVMGR
jgi:hypothetical protein